MTSEFFGITWQAVQYLKWIFLLIPFVVLIFWQYHNRSQIISKLIGNQHTLLLNYSKTKQIIKMFLLILGVVFIFLALLQPAWGKKEQLIEQEGRDLLIALDVSRSMLAEDRLPNRLSFAKEKIKQLVNQLNAERIGLILFSGSTIVQCPLTTDYGAFFLFLDQLDAQTISSGTTSLDQAIKQALTIFEGMPTKKHKLVVVLTDGEDFSSNLADIRSRALQEGLTIFTIGLGTLEGAPIPVLNEQGEQIGHQKDEKGNIVISRLNEGILRSLAHESGGIYLRATDTGNDIKTLLERVREFEKEKFEEKHVNNLIERYPYFVVLAFLCFALEWLL
ncbi:MAG: VWA domain-containing protein [Candidatus Babeliales bacterium]